MTEQEKAAEWSRYVLSMKKHGTGVAIRCLSDPYAEGERMGDATMKILGLPSMTPFLKWARA